MPREDAAQFNGTLKTATYPNKYNAVIPAEGPFYRIGLKLTVKDATAPGGKRTLIEGLDYYLGYYFKELAEAEQDQIYGGFILLTASEVDYEFLAVGRQYRLPQSEIGKYLVKTDLPDPRNVDWSELMKYAPVISPIDPPENLDEAILRDEVVKALEDIRLGILERASELDGAFTELTDMIYQNGNTVFEQEMYQHHLKSNAHGYTTTDVGALPVVGKAVDATKAFGRTLAELVTLMSTSGISQAHVDLLMDNTLGDLLGRLRVLNNDAITFQTTAGHLISMKGEKFIITSPKPLVLKADQDNNDPGIGVEFSAGLNTLWVHSGAAADVLAPVFNSVYLVTPEMVGMYLTSVKLLPANAYFKSSDTLKIYGSGKDTNRVYMNVELPTATTAVAGLFSITNISNSVATGAAISQKAVNDLKNKLDLYVDDTYSINGKKFVKGSDGKQVLTLTKTDFGIDKMDNTAPLEKPVTKALTAALASKAKTDHTHTLADLDNVPYGSTSVSGLVKLWDAIDSTDDKMVTSKQGYAIDQSIKSLNEKVNTLLPSWTVGGAEYGNPSFLPIPTVSNYAGFGYDRSNNWAVARYEGGNVYVLRNGSDGPEDTRRVYYWYASIGGSNNFLKNYPTTFPYHPAGMSKFPGVVLTRVVVGDSDAAIFEASDGLFYLVLFNGTMNYATHNDVYQITLPDCVRSNGSTLAFKDYRQYSTVTVTKGRVVVLMSIVNNTRFTVGGWSISLSELRSKNSSTIPVINFNYPDKDGDVALIVQEGGYGDDATTKFLAYRTAEGKARWPNGNAVNYLPSFYSASQVNMVRLRAEMHGYFSDNTSAQWTDAWSVSLSLNTENWLLTLENKIFPIALTENKIEFPNAQPLPSVTNRNKGVALTNRVFLSSGLLMNSFCDVYSNNPPRIGISPAPNTSLYDLLGSSTTLIETANATVGGAVGSVYQQYMRGLIHLGGTANTVLMRHLNVAAEVIQLRYTQSSRYFPDYPGWGPDNARIAVTDPDYRTLLSSPNIWKDGQLYINGRVITEAGSFPYKTVTGTSTFTADRITVTDATWAALNAAIAAAVPVWNDELVVQTLTKLQVFDVGGLNAAFAMASVRMWDNTSRLVTHTFTWVWKLPMSVTNGNVQLGTTMLTPVVENYRDPDAGISLAHDQYTNSKLIQRDDGYVLFLGALYRMGVVGDSRWRSFLLSCDTTFGGWTNSLISMNPSSNEVDIVVMPETGYIGMTKWLFNGLYFAASVYKNTVRNFRTGTPEDNILAGTKTAEGWALYITEQELLRFGSAYYTLGEYSSDIRDLYPTNYQNRTFYMHAALVNGVPQYRLLEQQEPDSDTQLYIGTVVTDSERITLSTFDKVKRFGNVKQLVEHAAVANRHDVSAAREARIGSMAQLSKVPLATPGSGTAGYADGQELSKGITRQTRPALPIQKRYSGFGATRWQDLVNVSERFWLKPPVETAAVTADNARAASFNMKWIGAESVPHVAGETYVAVARLRFTVPGNIGDPARQITLRYAVPNGIPMFKYCLTSGVNPSAAEILFATGPDLVNVTGSGLPAGVEFVATLSAELTAAQYQTLKTKMLAIQVVDTTTGTVFRQTDVDTPFMLYALSDLTSSFGVVRVARELVIPNLPSEPAVVLNTGKDALNPPFVASYNSGTLTLTVACEYAGGNSLVDLDEIQVNLMFKS
ncbi:hypothetical protein G173_gp090 [Erwinia phage phiEaH2]|uniref:Virion structural protein n=1 Tax=Erwinia phage phiEaH2 TaxID=1029988 RepID=J7KKJ0_9CAUD|nr:hypothetical protein G173_gp090 [Erwinia phage phiEaH2]AFQ96635.1 hypothetical protein [Erwinia phage phiEaH2]